MERHPMTAAGAKALEAELEQLRNIERPRIVNAIAEARAHGDLKENAEYHAAREQQSFTEGRIQEIEYKLANAQVIDVNHIPKDGRVVFGVTVHLINIQDDNEVVYKIVGEDEADIKNAKISFNSPIARALISKEEGDVVEVKTPGGIVEYEISQVECIE
jgi:transcription elongation factor GreA